jgi:outer membrane protein assembly factor BamB
MSTSCIIAWPHLRFLCGVAALAAAAWLVGCDGGEEAVPDFVVGPDLRRNELLVPYQTASDLGYRVDWETTAIVSDGFRMQELNVLDDVVVTREGGTIMTVLDASDGQLRWTHVLGNPLQNFVGTVRVDDRLLVSSSTELLHYEVETGQLLDKQRLKTVVNTRPAVVGDLAIYGCANGHLLAHNFEAGFMEWAYDMFAAIETPPVLVGEDVCVVNKDGLVMTVTPAGESIGRRSLFGPLANRPVSTDDLVFLASTDQSIWALTRRNLQAHWRYRTDAPLTAQPVLIGETLYQYVPTEGLVAINITDGSVVWRCPEARGRVLTQNNDRILAWQPNTMYEIDLATGRLINEHELPRLLEIESSNMIDGDLYFINSYGRLAKLIPLR